MKIKKIIILIVCCLIGSIFIWNNAYAESTVTISRGEANALAQEKISWPSGTPKRVWKYPYGKKKFTSWKQLRTARPCNAYKKYVDKTWGRKHWRWGGKHYPGSRVGASCNFTVGVGLKMAGMLNHGLTLGNAGSPSKYKKAGWYVRRFNWRKPPTLKRGDLIVCKGKRGFHIWCYLGKDTKGHKHWSESAQENVFQHAYISDVRMLKTNIKSWRCRKWYLIRAKGKIKIPVSKYKYMVKNPSTPKMVRQVP